MKITASSTKEKTSDDVFITIHNECRAQIKIYEISQSKQYLYGIYDCSCTLSSPIHLKPGKYKIVVETFQGKTAERAFTKTMFSEDVTIEFTSKYCKNKTLKLVIILSVEAIG
jgi:hypothetical protein